MSKDYFQYKSHNYEEDKNRVNNVENIAESIKQNIVFNKTMHIMDFGSGTGLLLEKIASLVNKITAVDISKSMNEQLEVKRENLGCDLDIIDMDLSKSKLDQNFDGIISSMTMHHVKDVKNMFDNFYSMIINNGFIAIADLDLEDGSFHTEDTGVFHFGFDRKQFLNFAKKAGFRELKTISASIAYKPYGKFPIFLLLGYK